MSGTNLLSIDMNLLGVLSLLLETKSTTKTAEKLGRSQSAVSHSLRRLRETLDDPILVREGLNLVPTARALDLQPKLSQWIAEGNGLVFDAPEFDPTASTRTFRLAATDYILTTFLAPLIEVLCEEAPGVNIHCLPVPTADERSRMFFEGELDVAFMVTQIPETLRAKRLFRDRFVAIVADSHPCQDATVDLATFAAFPHVLTAPSGKANTSALSKRLALAGLERRIAVTVPHFSMGPLVLSQGPFILTLPGRLALAYAQQHGHRVLKLGFDAPEITVYATWHERMHRDPGHKWLRSMLMRACA